MVLSRGHRCPRRHNTGPPSCLVHPDSHLSGVPQAHSLHTTVTTLVMCLSVPSRRYVINSRNSSSTDFRQERNSPPVPHHATLPFSA
ncbi:hypothetical protein Hamer_G009500 [Homarus americanus]|uniref:Uncharacterized protein n=1 Tax=Homarus americanus TaxID=6706 RepID=A0A8J5J5S0_HOMAM|nr:hypothetical protein Hamer_G009500 [Homarus americanus]